MGESLKLGLRLFLFAVIAAVALAATNEITKGPIAEQAVAKANSAREVVLPGTDAFEPVEITEASQYPYIESVHRAVRSGEETGYTFLIEVRGYRGPIVMTLAVNRSGSINALAINSQTETAGLGNKVAGEPFLAQFPGIAANPDRVSAQVDAISGATVSSRAVMAGVEQALRYARDVLGIEPKAGEVVTAETVSAYREIEEQTGTEGVKQLGAFEAAGFPNIQRVYEAKYNGNDAYLFEFDGRMVILSASGRLIEPQGAGGADDVAEAQRYLDEFLKKGVSGG